MTTTVLRRREYFKEYYNQKKLNGLCVYKGCNNKSDAKRLMCAEHNNKSNVSKRKHNKYKYNRYGKTDYVFINALRYWLGLDPLGLSVHKKRIKWTTIQSETSNR